jgi:CoA:oxalate CoA-transferase
VARPLDGITVIDTTSFAMGPCAAGYLADMGARVIKVEEPFGGDRGRGVRSVRHLSIGRYNWLFEMLNRGKQSLGLNWKSAKGREMLYRLIERADIFITSQKPRSLAQSGLDYETLSKINPRIIYAHCTGWGSRGPYRNVDAFDLIAFARAGLMTIMGEPDSPPVKCIPGAGDEAAGVILAYGILLALFHRERTGEGQKVESSLFGAQISIFGHGSLQSYLANEQEPNRDSRKHPGNALTNTYRTKDGRWLMLSMMTGDSPWPEFCEAAGITELVDDPRFNSHESRCDNADALRRILDDVFASRTLSEWTKSFEGCEFAWSPCQTIRELTQDPQVIENEHITTFDHPRLGTIKMVGLPVKLSRTPGQTNYPAPEVGQHTEEILLELGYDWQEILSLKDEHIIT